MLVSTRKTALRDDSEVCVNERWHVSGEIGETFEDAGEKLENGFRTIENGTKRHYFVFRSMKRRHHTGGVVPVLGIDMFAHNGFARARDFQ